MASIRFGCVSATLDLQVRIKLYVSKSLLHTGLGKRGNALSEYGVKSFIFVTFWEHVLKDSGNAVSCQGLK